MEKNYNHQQNPDDADLIAIHAGINAILADTRPKTTDYEITREASFSAEQLSVISKVCHDHGLMIPTTGYLYAESPVANMNAIGPAVAFDNEIVVIALEDDVMSISYMVEFFIDGKLSIHKMVRPSKHTAQIRTTDDPPTEEALSQDAIDAHFDQAIDAWQMDFTAPTSPTLDERAGLVAIVESLRL